MKQPRTTGIGVFFRAVLNFAIRVISVIFVLFIGVISVIFVLFIALFMILDRIGYVEAFGRALREGYGKNLNDTISLIESIGDVLLVVTAICLGFVLLAKRKR